MAQKIKEELENKETVVFWDYLSDFDTNWITVLRLFVIRLAYTLVHVHVRKHPDELL
jgi:hypothetical protein